MAFIKILSEKEYFMKKNFMKIAAIFAVLILGTSVFAETDFAIDFGPSFSNYNYDDGGEKLTGNNHFGLTFMKTIDSDWAWKIHADYQSFSETSMFGDDTAAFSLVFGTKMKR